MENEEKEFVDEEIEDLDADEDREIAEANRLHEQQELEADAAESIQLSKADDLLDAANDYAARTIHINKNIDDLPDSISLGTDGKLGCVKVYIDAKDVKGSEEKIVNALRLRKYMREQEAIIESVTQSGDANGKPKQ